MLDTGHWRFLERLEGTMPPGAIFRQISGIGPELAERIYEDLGIDTLEALETAAHDGRLDAVEGFGERRLQAVRESVESKLRARRRNGGTVPVAEVLDVDREYREKAANGELRRIAPRRFNPEGEAWLPILHTERDDRSYTALYSNTARAHDLGKTDDWVVIYREDDEQAQWTVVTESSGPMAGKRVVRGREADCRQYYDEQANDH
jgi:putative hydrolase